MSKVSVTLGLTLKMNSGGGFNFFRPEITISDIETETDIAPQIERSLSAIHEVWSAVEKNMEKIVDSSEIAEKPSALTEINKRIAEFEADLSQLKTKMTAGGGASLDISDEDDENW